MSDENSRKTSLTPWAALKPGSVSGFSRMIVVFMMAMLLFFSVEQSQAAEKYVTIVNSPEVKQKLQQASPAERKRMEKAIKNGNRFIQLRFNDEDTDFYTDPDGDEIWKKKMAPIMSMSLEKWQDYRNARWKIVVDDSKTSGGYLLIACPIVILSQLNINNDITTLIYRATLIGRFPYLGGRHYEKIDISKSGKHYELQINLNSKHKLLNEYSTEKQIATSNYEYDSINRFRLNSLRLIKNKSDFVYDDIKVIDDTLNKLKSLTDNCKKP
ncbi:MAG: hypothetical protein LWW87_13260 [Geobacteraceae bacterium]|nr:hypothetical protein [Geobacteraceae bacterium]